MKMFSKRIIFFLSCVYQYIPNVYSCSGTTNLIANRGSIGEVLSQNYPNFYSNNLDCSWLITASDPSYKIVINIDDLNLERHYDFLYIYDGSSTSGTRLFYSRYNTDTSFFTGSSAYIRFTSDYSVTYTGFRLQYTEAENNELCSGTLTASSTSSDIVWTSNTQCQVTISTSNNNGRVGLTMPFSWNYITISDSTSSNNAYLHSGVYISDSNTITVYYTRNTFFQYEEVATSATTPPIATTAPPAIPTVEFTCLNSIERISSATYIVSPNYPSSYYSNLNCYTTLESSNTNMSLSLVVQDIEIEYPSDLLRIFDGLTTSYTWLASPSAINDNVTSSGASLALYFRSNGYANYRGFKLLVTPVARNTAACVSSYTTLTAGTTEQVMGNPSYPSNYANNYDQYWLIVKPAEYDNIVLDFRVMDLELSSTCVYDFVKVYDGWCDTSPLLARLCGTNQAVITDSTGYTILLHFHTDVSVTSRGFQMYYYIGTYTAPDSGESTEDGTSFVIFIVPAVFGGIIFISVIAAIVISQNQRKSRVAQGTSLPKTQTTVTKKTTGQLLDELKEKKNNKKPRERITRKPQPTPQPPQPTPQPPQPTPQPAPQPFPPPVLPPQPHPPPNPPGPNTNIIQRGGVSPHPDPVYPPPMYFVDDPVMPPSGGLTPVMPQGYNPSQPYLPPFTGTPPNMGGKPSMIPSPFTYITPSEARSMRGEV